MGRPSLREKILVSGVRTLHEQGYGAAGIRDITAAAGVPQGSFTNHFASKEAFAVATLERYYEGIEATITATLYDEARSPAARLRAYFDTVTERLDAADWHHGCLIGNFGLETSEHSEALRTRLDDVLDRITGAFAETVRAAQVAGEMRADMPADEIASALLSSWQGAMLWMKVQRSGAAIERFKRVTLAAFLTTVTSISPPGAHDDQARSSQDV